MKEASVDIGKLYALRSQNGGEVTNENGEPIVTLEANTQQHITAQESVWLVPDDCKVTKANFKRAALALGLLGGGSILPSGYSRLEFLEATGSQTIKMNGLFDKHTGLRLEAETFEDAGNTSCVSFLTQNPSAEGYWWVFPPRANAQNSSLWEWYWFKKSGSFSGIQLATRYVATINYKGEKKASIEQNGTLAAKKLPDPLDFSSTVLNVINSNWRGRCYSVRVSRNTALENNFLPALDETGTPCMFDTVSKTAFRNAGSGQFVVGMTLSQVRGLRLPAGGGELTLSLPYEAAVDQKVQEALEAARLNGWTLTVQYREGELPAGWRREVSFLESTGTQYIDTGVKLSNESEVRCKFEPLNFAENQYIYGASTQHLVDDFSCLLQGDNTKICAFRYGTQSLPTSGIKNTITELKHSRDVYIDDNLRFSFKDAVFESAKTCRVFDRNGLPLIGRIYSFSISRAGEMQVDYVPCIAPDGTLGMYNRVDGTVQENAGTGAFIAGLATVDDVRTLWLPETGGPLTLSVPADTPDSAVEQLRKNNPSWQIAIQYRTENNEN